MKPGASGTSWPSTWSRMSTPFLAPNGVSALDKALESGPVASSFSRKSQRMRRASAWQWRTIFLVSSHAFAAALFSLPSRRAVVSICHEIAAKPAIKVSCHSRAIRLRSSRTTPNSSFATRQLPTEQAHSSHHGERAQQGVKPPGLIKVRLLIDRSTGYVVGPCRAGVARAHQKAIVAGRKFSIVGGSGARDGPVAIIAIQLVAELHLRRIRQILRIELKDKILESRRERQSVGCLHAGIPEDSPGQLRRMSGRRDYSFRIGVSQTFGGGEPQGSTCGPDRVWLSYAKTFTAGHTVGLAQQDGIQRFAFLMRQFFELLSLHPDDPARGSHPQKSLAVIEHGENGVIHHAVHRVQVEGMVTFEPVEAATLGSHPHVPSVVDGDRQHVRVRHPLYQ